VGTLAETRAEDRADDGDLAGVFAVLQELWGEVLGRFRPQVGTPTLGPDVDFFAAGGTSILAIMMLGRVYDELGVDVSFRALMERPTIRGIGLHIVDSVLAEPIPVRTTRAAE
jgi:aryl carrier-like protein